MKLKKIKLFFLSLLSLLSFQLCSCNGKKTNEIPFTLNSSVRLGSTFIRSKEEFDNYLSDETIFKPELSEEFKKINSKYDEKYFKKKDLVASIIWVDGGSERRLKRNKIEIKDDKWLIYFKVVYFQNRTNYIMGKTCCYYTELTKKDGVNDIEVIVEK